MQPRPLTPRLGNGLAPMQSCTSATYICNTSTPFQQPAQMGPQLVRENQISRDATTSVIEQNQFNWQNPYYRTYGNVPRRKARQMHVWLLIATIYLLAGVIGGALCMALDLIDEDNNTWPIFIMVQAYLIYIAVALGCDKTWRQLENTKTVSECKQYEDTMMKGAPVIRFHISCIITWSQDYVIHSATKLYHPRRWRDESGPLQYIQGNPRYVLLKYHQYYYFSSQQAKDNYTTSCNRFIEQHDLGQKRKIVSTLHVPGYWKKMKKIAVHMGGGTALALPLIFLFTFLGLAYPYCLCLQFFMVRYEINILKNIQE